MNARGLTLALALVPLGACSDRNFWHPKNQLLPMVALDDRVAFVEQSSQTAFVLDPADRSFTPRKVTVGKAPVTAVKRNNANELLVLTRGDRGSASEVQVPAELDRIAASASTADVFPLTGRFDAIAQSDDGRFAVLYHSPSAQSQDDSPLSNANEMTVVDFTPPVTPNTPKLTPRTIRSFGGVPREIRFSPPYPLMRGSRTLGVVLSENYVTLLDLDNGDRTEISVPLCPDPAGCNLTPVQVVFDPANLNLYLRVSGAKDLYAIHLTDLGSSADWTSPDNDFSASMSMLAVGGAASDVALFRFGQGNSETRLAVGAPDIKSLVIIDPKTSQTTTVPTAIPVNQIIPFVTGLGTADAKQHALLVDLGGESTAVLFADLQDVETKRGMAIDEFPLGAGAREAHALIDQGIVVLVAGSFSNSAALTVVDLAKRSFSAWGASEPLSVTKFEARAPGRLWGATSGTNLFHLDLASLTVGEVWLDQTITDIVPLSASSASSTTRYLVVKHNDPNGIGNLTLLDADAPSRTGARTGYGFLLNHYLEQELP